MGQISLYNFPKEFTKNIVEKKEFQSLPNYQKIIRLIESGSCEALCLLKKDISDADIFFTGDERLEKIQRKRKLFFEGIATWFKSERNRWEKTLN